MASKTPDQEAFEKALTDLAGLNARLAQAEAISQLLPDLKAQAEAEATAAAKKTQINALTAGTREYQTAVRDFLKSPPVATRSSDQTLDVRGLDPSSAEYREKMRNFARTGTIK